MKKQNYIFLIIIFLIILLGDITLVRKQKLTSLTENRKLQQFEHFELDSYLSGSYQSKLETALSDQFVGGETIKSKTKAVLNIFNYNNIPCTICKNKYVKLSSDYYSFNCDDALVVKYIEKNNENIKNIKERINIYNKLNEFVDAYYYFLSTPNIFNFETNEYTMDVYSILKENLKGNYKISSLEFKNYEEYTNYFYKTDHHWNHKGSYKAYKDIISMVRPNDKILEPVEEIVFDNIIFYGSEARISQIFSYKENFIVYKFNLPEFKILDNKSGNIYGNEEDYYNGTYMDDKLANHYGIYYGGDSAEVVFDTQKNKYNVLILGSSYTNAIDKLIASHFNKTFDVDLRHYENTFGEKFNIKKYIEENNINKVIILADYGFLIDDNFDIEWVN